MVACYGLTEFEFDEKRDLHGYPVWILWPQFAAPIRSPLYTSQIVAVACHGSQWGAEMSHSTMFKGYDGRLVDGVAYHAIIELSEEEMKQRMPLFQEAATPWIEDYEKEWDKYKAEMNRIFQPLKDHEPLSKLSDIELLVHLDDFQRADQRWWDVHFYVFMFPLAIYMMFGEICDQLTGIGIDDPKFFKLMGGFDNMLFRVNKALWSLGDRANELGLAQIFLTVKDNEEVLHTLEESDAGRRWLEEYQEFLKAHGWRAPSMFDWDSPTWIEQPGLGITPIRQGLLKGGTFALDRHRERLAKERKEIEREVLDKVPAGQKDWFEKLMTVAQKSGMWLEEHDYYMDMPGGALGRHVFQEYGRRFAQAGVIEEPHDIYFLMVPEIRRAAIPMGRANLRPDVKRYKDEYEAYRKLEPKPFLGDIGYLQHLIETMPGFRVQAAPQKIRPELKADLYGAGSSPGVVEGVARVIMSEANLDEVQPGEILVSPGMAAPWIPIFSIVAGAVTDVGGSLFHPVICGREYGIPCVAGTREATRKIKTGDLIRVDGDNCAVYILKREA